MSRRLPRSRSVRACLVALAAAAALAGCGGAVPSPTRGTADSDGMADESPVAASEPAASASSAASTPSPSDPVTGSFRRGGVPVPPAVLAQAVDACRALPTPPYAEDIGARPVVVSDLRGESVVVLVFADRSGATGCRAVVGEDTVASLFAVDGQPDRALEEGQITIGAYELDDGAEGQRTIAVGRYGDRVVKVRAGFDDDTYVTSSMDNGWYAMWWRGTVRPAVIVAADNRNVAMGMLTPPTGTPAP